MNEVSLMSSGESSRKISARSFPGSGGVVDGCLCPAKATVNNHAREAMVRRESTLKKAVFSLQTKSQKSSFKKNPVYKKERKSEFLLTKVGKWGIEIDFKRAPKIDFLLTELRKNMLFSSFFGGFQGPREPFFTF